METGKLTRQTINQLGVEPRNFPQFSIGDTVAVSQWITEGSKKRIQIFEGDLIGRHNNGASSTFTVRKLGANGIYVERIYPYYSPIIDSIKIIRQGDVRRAKLYYLRDRIGKRAQVKELVLTREQKELAAKKKADAKKVVEEKVKQVQIKAAAPKKVAKSKPVASPKKEVKKASSEKVDTDKKGSEE